MTIAAAGASPRQTIRLASHTLVALVATLLVAAPVLAAGSLEKAISGALADARLGSSEVGYIVMDPATGEVLASQNEGRSFIPASNMKLLTSGAALLMLGPDFRFETTLELAGDTLIIRGSGDPALADPTLLSRMHMSVDELLDAWVEQLKAAGAKRINEIVLDERVFDQQFVHPTWPADQLNRRYCAEVWGLNFHANVISVFASPARAEGASPYVRLEPDAPWMSLQNVARTVKKGPNTLWVARPPLNNAMKLIGNVRWATEEPVQVAIHDMPSEFGRMLATRIEKAGLGRAEVRRAGLDETLPAGHLISVVRTPMDVVLERCNTDSYNLYAEALIKRMGHELTGQPGSWSSGASVIRMLMQQRLGPREAASLVVSDGSGMSRENQVTPRLVAGWLGSLYSEESIREAYLKSLAEPAESGTLERRFAGRRPALPVRAKSGYLNGVSSLSGYVFDPITERSLVFSVLINEIPGNLPFNRVKNFQEQVVLLTDAHLGALTGGLAGVSE
ncbi:MAG: D-alanyl-D-alanine carboxypeptidase/D-alanyl-D-alanine-endopeptidase [Planctomycetota bacterium]|nr:D-alanyl-D-alanine carboxypeptidase/D-alanyl-D-alanine-endopeptidase [Planctomycetota bacterium]